MKLKREIIFLTFIACVIVICGNANADHMFGTPTNIGYGTSPSVSTDGLSLYVDAYEAPGGYGDADIWVYTREDVHDDWSGPVNLGPTINTWSLEGNPDISADGLTLFFDTDRPGGQGGRDLWYLTRETPDDDWSEPKNLGPTVNGLYYDGNSCISRDGLTLYFTSDQPDGYGGRDIWFITRETTDDDWSEPKNLGPTVNSPSDDYGPDISSDGLKLFFDSYRPGGYGERDIWLTTRVTTEDDWGIPENLGPIVNTLYRDITACISADGSILYFWSNRPVGGGLIQMPIIPIIDFDSNGMVDINDLVIMIENWGTDNSLCDIGPMSWGDGIVNRADLEVLMEYYNQVVDVAAYYKLDEIEGAVAYDSSGYYCDANVIGDPNWQSEGGMIDGAIILDGNDNYINTPFILNPRETSEFSVFAWIKGGLPGQVILSQADSVDWLSTDTEGNLMTELKGGRGACDLLSEVVVTDGDWHRVGLTWDDFNKIRTLYVDDVIAAIDTQPGLEGSYDGLYIGAGKDLEPGTFFSGLIDDVRIYDRLIIP